MSSNSIFDQVLKKFSDNFECYIFLSKLKEYKVPRSANTLFLSGEESLHEEVRDCKTEYFTAFVLWNSIISSMIESNIFCFDPTVSHSTKKELDTFVSRTCVPLTLRYIPMDNTVKELNLLGLKRQNAVTTVSNIAKLNSGVYLATPGTDDQSVRRQASNIAMPDKELTQFQSLIMSNMKTYEVFRYGGKRYNFCMINKLIEMVVHDSQDVLSFDVRFSGSLDILTEQVSVHFNELLESIGHLRKMLEILNRKLKLKSEIAAYYSIRCVALNLKARVLAAEISAATYSNEVLNCHRKIRSNLDKNIEFLKADILSRSESLKSFQILGSSYAALVEEYTQITNLIKREKWAIAVLDKKHDE